MTPSVFRGPREPNVLHGSLRNGNGCAHQAGHGLRLAPAPDLSSSEREPATGDGPGGKRILILDDCRIFRECLVRTLALNGIPLPAVAWDLASLVRALGDIEISVLLLSMSTQGSQLLLRATMDIDPSVRVIALGLSADDESCIIACAEAGVAGFHMRTDSLDDLVVLTRKVAAGEMFCPPPVTAILLQRLLSLSSHPPAAVQDLALTAREVQILGMLELGRSNRDIAEHLNIAVHTVKNHVHSLLTKLGVTTRAQAAALSRAHRTDRGIRWS